ncbi:MAG: hypothetical protein ACJA02_000888 [Myxococcota bacterium]|jgi:hypothetical protein
MKQIDLIASVLDSIGFESEKNDDSIQIVRFDGNENQEFPLEEISDSIGIFITFDDPLREESDYLFQGCDLRVYFDDQELEYQAKEIKFYVASILNDHGIFDHDKDLEGVKKIQIPHSPDEMIVP